MRIKRVGRAALVMTAMSFGLGVAAPASAQAWQDYDKPYIGETVVYESEYEDTLVEVARKFDLGFVELRAANPFIDPWMPGDGVKMTLPSMHLLPPGPRRGLVINLPEMRMYAYLKPGEAPQSFPLGIGREGLSTPIGSTRITRKKEGPSWRPTARMREEDPKLPAVVEPGPDNPLGTHAMYLGWPEYLIHGTNKPYGIGRRSSSGCMRMYPEDIITLFEQVEVDTPVNVVNEPVKAAWIDNKFYVEAHPTMAQADAMEQDGGLPDYEISNEEMVAIMNAAGDDGAHIDWEALRQVIRERNGMPITVGARPERRADAVAAEADPS